MGPSGDKGSNSTKLHGSVMILFQSGQLDLRHFDPEFVREPVPASVGRSGSSVGKLVSASVMEADAVFDGFSYVPPAEDAFG